MTKNGAAFFQTSIMPLHTTLVQLENHAKSMQGLTRDVEIIMCRCTLKLMGASNIKDLCMIFADNHRRDEVYRCESDLLKNSFS